MRIVLDTNVLVSGLLSPFGPPGDIVRLIAAGEVRVCYDGRIMDEYREVLSRPAFRIAGDRVESLLHQIAADGLLVTAQPLAVRLPDPDDEAFLAVALAGGARCLATGNLGHYPEADPAMHARRASKRLPGSAPGSRVAGPGMMPVGGDDRATAPSGRCSRRRRPWLRQHHSLPVVRGAAGRYSRRRRPWVRVLPVLTPLSRGGRARRRPSPRFPPESTRASGG